jgi:hypothetical protein
MLALFVVFLFFRSSAFPSWPGGPRFPNPPEHASTP